MEQHKRRQSPPVPTSFKAVSPRILSIVGVNTLFISQLPHSSPLFHPSSLEPLTSMTSGFIATVVFGIVMFILAGFTLVQGFRARGLGSMPLHRGKNNEKVNCMVLGGEEPASTIQHTVCNVIFANTPMQPPYIIQGEAPTYDIRLTLSNS